MRRPHVVASVTVLAVPTGSRRHSSSVMGLPTVSERSDFSPDRPLDQAVAELHPLVA